MFIGSCEGRTREGFVGGTDPVATVPECKPLEGARRCSHLQMRAQRPALLPARDTDTAAAPALIGGIYAGDRAPPRFLWGFRPHIL